MLAQIHLLSIMLLLFKKKTKILGVCKMENLDFVGLIY